MKRDLDLIRSILLDIEAHPDFKIGKYSLAGSDGPSFAHNMTLMIEHDLIDATVFQPLDGLPAFHNVRLSWAGSDFLDSIRDEEIWKNTKAGAAKVGGFTFDLIKQLASGLVRTQLEKHTGVKLGS